MKCYTGSRCGNCKYGRLVPLGECPLCGCQNGEDAAVCVQCGYRFPPSPGKPRRSTAGDDAGASEDNPSRSRS